MLRSESYFSTPYLRRAAHESRSPQTSNWGPEILTSRTRVTWLFGAIRPSRAALWFYLIQVISRHVSGARTWPAWERTSYSPLRSHPSLRVGPTRKERCLYGTRVTRGGNPFLGHGGYSGGNANMGSGRVNINKSRGSRARVCTLMVPVFPYFNLVISLGWFRWVFAW